MADLDDLLESPVDEIEDVEVPEGTFYVTSFTGKLSDEQIDKNDNPYRRATVGLKVVAPVEDSVDPEEWERFEAADGKNEASLFYSAFLSRRRDIKQLERILQTAGVPTSGRKLTEMLDELKDGYEFVATVAHHEEFGAQVQRLSGKTE